MTAIGIDDTKYLFYEGDGASGHAMWPPPVLSIATILRTPDDFALIPTSDLLTHANFVFREDSFDPVTRVRRGRVYKASPDRPYDWRVQAHPAYAQEAIEAPRNNGWLTKRLYGFNAWQGLREGFFATASLQIALGTKNAYTIWRVADIERIVTGEDLLTLRARSSLGALPELNMSVIPQDGKGKVIETLERLVTAAHRAGPEDVIEAARAAAQWCLGVHLSSNASDPKIRQKDLGELTRLLAERSVSQSVAQILGRLHSRAKPNEQDRYETRPLREEDAEFALAAVSMLLRELKWAI